MLWCRAYDVDIGSRGVTGSTVGKNTKQYVNNQLKKDWMAD